MSQDKTPQIESSGAPSDGVGEQRTPVVVLDVDDVLCSIVSRLPEDLAPDCTLIPYEEGGSTWTHVFIPHIDVLLRALPAWGMRVVFFSSAAEVRNLPLLTQLVDWTLGAEAAARARADGQFAIHSKPDLRPSLPDTDEDGINVKDMRRVVRAGERLDDVILVEDQPSYAAGDQRPCLKALDVGAMQPGRGDDRDHYEKNGAAWILGVVDTLLHEPRFAELPLRPALDALLLEAFGESKRASWCHMDPAQDEIVNRGLAVIRSEVPEAVFYGLAWKTTPLPEGALHSREQACALLDAMLRGDRDPCAPAVDPFLSQLESRPDLADDEPLKGKVHEVRRRMEQCGPHARGGLAGSRRE